MQKLGTHALETGAPLSWRHPRDTVATVATVAKVHTVTTVTTVSQLLICILVTFISLTTVSCGNPESFSSLSTTKATKADAMATGQDKKGAKDTPNDTPEDETATPPQSVAGLYLLSCGDYIPSPTDADKSPSIGCDITDDKGGAVAMSRMEWTQWIVMDAQGTELKSNVEDTDSDSKRGKSGRFRIHAQHNSGRTADAKTVEFHYSLKGGPKTKLTFTFQDQPTQLALAGSWRVKRVVVNPAESTTTVTRAVLDAGKLEIKFTPGSTSAFTAFVSGDHPFSLDYGKSAAVGTQIFGGSISPNASRALALPNPKQNVLPIDLNRSPVLDIIRNADGTIASLRMTVIQPYYGETSWDFTRAQ